MDDFDDDLDLDSPEGLVLAAAIGLLDDPNCACWCDCRRAVPFEGELCDLCAQDRHRDPADPSDRR
ncbi:MAG: hypothetical protein AB1627_13940 [Chloroflexota bacterium]|jgi:hypothetical protein